MRLQRSFYCRDDVELIARELLGKMLVTEFDGVRTSGRIVETEAYAGKTDRASHAWNGRRTKRTEIMYCEGGTAYVYLIYGIYALFNVVTNKKDIPYAVLVRGLEPLQGIDVMLRRRGHEKLTPKLSAGPGTLTIALGITTTHHGISLLGNSPIWLEDDGHEVDAEDIAAGPRIGVDYAGKDALLHRRFWVKGNRFVSKGK